MKSIFLSSLACLLLFCIPAESSKKIRSITALTYTFKFTDGKYIKSASPQVASYTYDSLGHLVEKVEKETTSYKYLFGGKGEIIETSVFTQKDFLGYKELYSYDETGLATEKSKRTKTGKLLARTKYEYDNRRNMVKASIFDASNEWKEITSYVYNEKKEVMEDSALSKGNLRYEYSFAFTDGNLAREKIIYKDGNINSKILFSHDEKGHIISENHYSIDPEEEKIRFIKTISRKYDSRGQMTEMKTTDADDRSWNSIYRYDTGGNLAETNEFNSDSSLARTFQYTYDKDNRKLSEKCMNADGRNWWISRYDYSTPGSSIKTTYDGNGKIESKHVCIFDSSGRIAKNTLYGPDGGLLNETSFTYDRSGKLTRKSEFDPNGRNVEINEEEPGAGLEYSGNGIHTVTTTYDYDNQGNKIKAGIQFERMLITGFKYGGYDKQGNWTERTSYYRNTPFEIIERKIKYY
jgi:hypothetical protein